MRSIILGVLIAIVGSACDCKGSNGDIDPSDVRPADLYGWWTATDASGSVTVFGFFPKEDAAAVLPISPEEATADISAVYQGPRGSLGEPVQLATFEVKDGELLETVLRGASAMPGTQLRTRILALTPQRELTLQASSGASSSRAFAWAARCPSAQPNGVFDVQGQLCSTLYSTGTSLVVDQQGVVHAASGLAGSVLSCPTGKSPQATYSRFENACGPALNALPNFRESSMAADASTLHFAYEAFAPGDASRDHHLFYRYRTLGPRGDWTEEPVAGPLASGHPVYDMRLLQRDGQALIVVAWTDGTLRLYRREGGAWSLVPTLLLDGTPLTGWFVDATLDREGRLALLMESNHQLAYERPGGFELIRVPKGRVATGFGGGVAADGSGRIHVTYVYNEIGANPDGIGGWVVSGRGVYAVYDGTAWTTHELGPMTYPRIATHGDGPWRVVHGLGKARRTTLALTEVSRDGSLRSELIDFERTGGGTSPEPFYDTTAAAGPDGTIAAAWDGTRVYIRPPEDQLVRERKVLTFSFQGKGGGRVRSADGTIDCTATCTVEVSVGSRHQLFFEADSQSAIDQIPCPSNYMSLYGYCWYDVFPEEQGPVIIKFRETPVVSVTTVADGASTLMRLGARDGRVAMAASTSNGQFPIGDAVVDVGVAGEMIAVREADGRVWGAPLPATPVTVGLQSDGSASALFFADRPLAFPSGTVGSGSAPVVVLAHYAGGSFQGLERLAEVPSSTRLLAAAVGDDDAAAVVISSTDGFGSLGIPEWNMLVYRNASGSVVLRGLEAGAAVGGSAGLALGEGRAVVLLPNPFNDSVFYRLSFFDGGALVGTQTANGINPAGYVLEGDRLLSIWGPANSTAYLYLEHGMDGRQLVNMPLTLLAGGVGFAGLAPAPSGTIFARTSYGHGLEYGRLGDPSYLFTFGGDLLGNKAPPQMSDIGGSNFWIAVRHQGTVDYDVTQVENTYRTLLLQMRLP